MENTGLGLKEAVELIADLGVKAQAPSVVEINGKTYSRETLRRYGVPDKASPIHAATLTSLVDYITNCPEEMDTRHMIIQVESPERVELYSVLNEDRERETLFEAKALLPDFLFNREYDQETFVIAMQACFAPSDDRDIVLQFASNVVNMQEQNFSDDGVSQQAVIRTSLTNKDLALVPNPVHLVPYRCFLEVEQPASGFVFRMSEGRNGTPSFKLIEADGGGWKLEAMQNIKNWLAAQLRARLTDAELRSITILA